ncbi:MAG: S41 family peptidase [Xanthomonadales bacterium]|nr:S41 family peptidase [Xanthomonadales bacterium]
MKIAINSLLVLLVATAAAWAIDEEAPATGTQLTLDDMRTFTDVFNQIRNNFVEETDDRELLNAAIRGMLSELDPHSSYMEAEEFRKMDNDSQGRYSGIGVELALRDRQMQVVFVIQDGPADQAGIVTGDVITAIDGADLRGSDQQLAINALRGEVGSEVEVTVQHVNGEVSTYTVTRGFVEVNSVFSRPVDRDYGYFQITHFTRKSAEELAEQIEYMQDNRKQPLKGIVLDLRGNPGGVLQPAIDIADGFLENGLIVEMHGRADYQAQHSAHAGSWLTGIPMVVLVDGRSASASEVLAGALQDHGRALIVGKKTFGKGSVQSVLNLRNGSGMRLTTSRYYTPSGRSIQAEGIQPDIEIPSVQAIEAQDSPRRKADLDRHLDGESNPDSEAFESAVSPFDDYAMYQALILLKGAAALSPSN